MGPIVQIVIQAPNLARMFFAKTLGATGQICPMGHLKIQDGGHFFQDGRHFHYTKLFFN